MAWLNIKEDRNIANLSMLLGFLIGLFGTYYMVDHLYWVTGPICIFGLHFHHLYTGIIIAIIFMFLWFRNKEKREDLSLIYLFFFGFGLGMMVDDILDHFIFQLDPFFWFCN